MVVLPSNHRLAKRKAISPDDLVGETFVGVSHTAPVLRALIDDYLQRSGINITPDHETEHVVMGVSLIASTGGVGLLPAYAKNTRSVCHDRPLKGRHADCRAGPRLQNPSESRHVLKLPFEIGRVDRSCLEEGTFIFVCRTVGSRVCRNSPSEVLFRITDYPEVIVCPVCIIKLSAP